MPGVLAHGMQDGIDAQRQTRAQFSYDFNFLTGFARIAISPQSDGFIQRHTKHDVGVFELVGVIDKKRALRVWQDGTPVLLNRVIPAGTGGGLQGFSLQGRKVYQKAYSLTPVSCGRLVRAAILAVYLSRNRGRRHCNLNPRISSNSGSASWKKSLRRGIPRIRMNFAGQQRPLNWLKSTPGQQRRNWKPARLRPALQDAWSRTG